MIDFYRDCDTVLRKHLDYQNKIDSSPIEPRNEPKFKDLCQSVLGRYDIEYFRAIHQELKERGLIIMNIKDLECDELFQRNVVTPKGFHFYRTTSFVDKYEAERQMEIRERESHSATMDASKSARHSKYAAFIAVVISVIAILAPILQEKKTEEVIKNTNEGAPVVDSLSKVQSQSQTRASLVVHPLKLKR